MLGLDTVEIVIVIVVAVIFTAVGMIVAMTAQKKKLAQQDPGEAPDKARFAAAFQKTPVPAGLQPTSGIRAPAPAAGGAPPPAHINDDLDLTPGASTLAMRVVPDTSPAPMPGFAEVYKKIASGQIRGHVMVVGGPDRGRGVEIVGEKAISIGRGKNHTLNLNDPGVSTDQCEIVAEAGKVVLRDLGSKNGTYVNNQRIERTAQPLENCDIVTCGATKILMTLGA